MDFSYQQTFLRSTLAKDPFALGDLLRPEDVLRIESEFPALFNATCCQAPLSPEPLPKKVPSAAVSKPPPIRSSKDHKSKAPVIIPPTVPKIKLLENKNRVKKIDPSAKATLDYSYHPTFLRSALVKDPFALGDLLRPEDVLRIKSEFPGLFNAKSQNLSSESIPKRSLEKISSAATASTTPTSRQQTTRSKGFITILPPTKFMKNKTRAPEPSSKPKMKKVKNVATPDKAPPIIRSPPSILKTKSQALTKVQPTVRSPPPALKKKVTTNIGCKSQPHLPPPTSVQKTKVCRRSPPSSSSETEDTNTLADTFLSYQQVKFAKNLATAYEKLGLLKKIASRNSGSSLLQQKLSDKATIIDKPLLPEKNEKMVQTEAAVASPKNNNHDDKVGSSGRNRTCQAESNILETIARELVYVEIMKHLQKIQQENADDMKSDPAQNNGQSDKNAATRLNNEINIEELVNGMGRLSDIQEEINEIELITPNLSVSSNFETPITTPRKNKGLSFLDQCLDVIPSPDMTSSRISQQQRRGQETPGNVNNPDVTECSEMSDFVSSCKDKTPPPRQSKQVQFTTAVDSHLVTPELTLSPQDSFQQQHQQQQQQLLSDGIPIGENLELSLSSRISRRDGQLAMKDSPGNPNNNNDATDCSEISDFISGLIEKDFIRTPPFPPPLPPLQEPPTSDVPIVASDSGPANASSNSQLTVVSESTVSNLIKSVGIIYEEDDNFHQVVSSAVGISIGEYVDHDSFEQQLMSSMCDGISIGEYIGVSPEKK